MKISNGVNKKIPFPIAIIIIVVLAVSVGGLTIWQYLKMPAKTELPEIGTPPDQTADQKTYRNEEYGFEFKYPGEWLIINQGGDYVFFGTPNSVLYRGELFFWDNPQDLSPIKFYSDCLLDEEVISNYNSEDNYQEIIIEGRSAIFFSSLIRGGSGVLIPIKNKGKIIDLVVDPIKGSSEKLLNQMLSTFRFLE